jgi:hypothetical protein
MHVNVRFNGAMLALVGFDGLMVRDLGPTVGSGRVVGKWCVAPTNTHGGPAARLNVSTCVAWGASQFDCLALSRCGRLW